MKKTIVFVGFISQDEVRNVTHTISNISNSIWSAKPDIKKNINDIRNYNA